MIYSKDINKICALCQKAKRQNDKEMLCTQNNKTVAQNTEGCKHFSYDILKRPVRRQRRLKTNFNKEDFSL